MTKKQCVLVIENEVSCHFLGLDKEHLNLFVQAYASYAPNYFFHPLYKLGNWDGKIRFFTWNGQTYNTLIPEIVEAVVKLGYKITIEDKRSSPVFSPAPVTEDYFADVVNPETGEPIMLRDYQVAFANKLMETGNGIGIAATSAGKTFICGAMVEAYRRVGAKSIIIVPNADLVKQTRTELAFLNIVTGEYSGKTKDINGRDIIVSTWQALKNNPTVLTDRDVVLVDETHGARGNVLQELLTKHCPNIPHRFGVTGTMPEHPSEAQSVRCVIGEILTTIDAASLIEKGVLATIDINVLQLLEDLTAQYQSYLDTYSDANPDELVDYKTFKAKYFADYSSEKKYLSKAPERLNEIAGTIDSRKNNGNVLALVQSVEMGKLLSSLVPGSHFVYGKDDEKVRQEVYSLFTDNDSVVVFATYGIASTGLSIKRIHELFLIDIGKSFIRVIQSIGRGLRKAPDKQHINVWDICSDLTYAKKHLTKRKAMYKKAGYPHRVKKVDYKKAPQYDDSNAAQIEL